MEKFEQATKEWFEIKSKAFISIMKQWDLRDEDGKNRLMQKINEPVFALHDLISFKGKTFHFIFIPSRQEFLINEGDYASLYSTIDDLQAINIVKKLI